MNIEGLCVTLGAKGTIKRSLVTQSTERPLEDTTISTELMQFMDLYYHQAVLLKLQRINYIPLIREQLSDSVQYWTQLDSLFAQWETTDPILGFLARTEFYDRLAHYSKIFHNSQKCLYYALRDYSGLDDIYIKAIKILFLYKDHLPELDMHLRSLQSIAVTLTGIENEVVTQHIFRSAQDYFAFLLQHFIASRPNVAQCQFCSRLFFPKTKKKTLYCDRVILNGKTCKEIAPQKKRKERIATNKVLSQFQKMQNRMIARLIRTGIDKAVSPVDLNDKNYQAWLAKATDARDRYLAGELTEEEAMAIIYVPKKDELLEQISSELTLETAATQS
jgi:hypothetical protein